MFNFIKHATGFLINAASFGFVNFGRSKPWYVKVGFVALGLGLNLLINSVPAILFSMAFTAVLFTIPYLLFPTLCLTPKNTSPFQLIPVISFAIADKLLYLQPLY